MDQTSLTTLELVYPETVKFVMLHKMSTIHKEMNQVTTIGRYGGVSGFTDIPDICLKDRCISRHHAIIFHLAGTFYIANCSGLNPLRVDANLLQPGKYSAISDGSKIKIPIEAREHPVLDITCTLRNDPCPFSHSYQIIVRSDGTNEGD